MLTRPAAGRQGVSLISLAFQSLADVFYRLSDLAAGAAERFLGLTRRFVADALVVKLWVIGQVTDRLFHTALGGCGLPLEFILIHSASTARHCRGCARRC